MSEWRTALLAGIGVVGTLILTGMGIKGFDADMLFKMFTAAIAAVAVRSAAHAIGGKKGDS